MTDEQSGTIGLPAGDGTFPVLPLRDIVVFPHMIVPLFVGREKSIRALEEVMRADKQILLATQQNPSEDEPTPRKTAVRTADSRPAVKRSRDDDDDESDEFEEPSGDVSDDAEGPGDDFEEEHELAFERSESEFGDEGAPPRPRAWSAASRRSRGRAATTRAAPPTRAPSRPASW